MIEYISPPIIRYSLLMRFILVVIFKVASNSSTIPTSPNIFLSISEIKLIPIVGLNPLVPQILRPN